MKEFLETYVRSSPILQMQKTKFLTQLIENVRTCMSQSNVIAEQKIRTYGTVPVRINLRTDVLSAQLTSLLSPGSL